MLCRTPARDGTLPVPCQTYIGGIIHSARHSNMEMSMRSPVPLRSRFSSAARIDEYAYNPAEMSPIEIPTFAGASGLPVRLTTPDSAWINMSYAFLSRYGPS